MSRGGRGFSGGRGEFYGPFSRQADLTVAQVDVAALEVVVEAFGEAFNSGIRVRQKLSLVCALSGLLVTLLTTFTIVTEMGSFIHAVEDEMLCLSTLPNQVPHFNAPIYLANKSQIGKVDEILGPLNEVYFSVKMSEGMVASSFKKGDKVYISGEKLLPLERFLPRPKVVGECSMMWICEISADGRGLLQVEQVRFPTLMCIPLH